jgi:hypothetical protein
MTSNPLNTPEPAPTLAELIAEAIAQRAATCFEDPERLAHVRYVIANRADWCATLLGRRVRHGRFGPLLEGYEPELVYLADEAGWVPEPSSPPCAVHSPAGTRPRVDFRSDDVFLAAQEWGQALHGVLPAGILARWIAADPDRAATFMADADRQDPLP